MSYRELGMIDVKELLRRWTAGHSSRKIARETGIDRDTAARYVAVVTGLGYERGHEFSDEEVHAVAQQVQARPSCDPSAEWAAVAAHKERIAGWLEQKRPLRLTKIHTLLGRDGVESSYDTLWRYATQERGDIWPGVPGPSPTPSGSPCLPLPR